MSPPTARVGALRGVLVSVLSVLMTAAAHAAGGGDPAGTPLLLLTIACATVGALATTCTPVSHLAKIAAMVGALGGAQAMGHLTLAAAEHHGLHAMAPSVPMLVAHGFATLALATLITLAEYLYLVCWSVLSWLRLVVLQHSSPPAPVLRGTATPPVRSVLLRSGMGMRAPPVCFAPGA
ncbi:hypothetical protein BH11ACT6_BH11ACT6_16640 [soil metagenome]